MLVRMDGNINVPVKVRTHELNQAHEFIPRVAERLGSIDVEHAQEQAEELERIYAEHVEDVEATYPEGPEFAAYISMPAEDWRTVVGATARLYDEETLRVRWFRKKLVKRLQARLEEMED